MSSHTLKFFLLPTAALTALILAGCSRPQPTAEQLAGPTTPLHALHLGPSPAGGSSEAPTGGGAGGSAAGGYQFGRISSTLEQPTLPVQPAGITYSRMSPVGSSGSGNGDRDNPIPPEVSLAAPPDPAPHISNKNAIQRATRGVTVVHIDSGPIKSSRQ